MTKSIYGSQFYDDQASGSRRSAQQIVPYLLELTEARSVVDVGSGVGTWLSVYEDCGVADLLGLDGPWVDARRLLVSSGRFRAVDLTSPPPVERRFDLAQSLEVAEHLPASYASAFVDYLTQLADLVVFSAAAPCQGGTHHVNEQWSGYWRDLFAQRGFAIYDVLRPRFWSCESVEWWYAQNMFLYVKREAHPRVVEKVRSSEGWVYPERIVHPYRIDPERNPPPALSGLVRALPAAVARTLARALS